MFRLWVFTLLFLSCALKKKGYRVGTHKAAKVNQDHCGFRVFFAVDSRAAHRNVRAAVRAGWMSQITRYHPECHQHRFFIEEDYEHHDHDVVLVETMNPNRTTLGFDEGLWMLQYIQSEPIEFDYIIFVKDSTFLCVDKIFHVLSYLRQEVDQKGIVGSSWDCLGKEGMFMKENFLILSADLLYFYIHGFENKILEYDSKATFIENLNFYQFFQQNHQIDFTEQRRFTVKPSERNSFCKYNMYAESLYHENNVTSSHVLKLLEPTHGGYQPWWMPPHLKDNAVGGSVCGRKGFTWKEHWYWPPESSLDFAFEIREEQEDNKDERIVEKSVHFAILSLTDPDRYPVTQRPTPPPTHRPTRTPTLPPKVVHDYAKPWAPFTPPEEMEAMHGDVSHFIKSGGKGGKGREEDESEDYQPVEPNFQPWINHEKKVQMHGHRTQRLEEPSFTTPPPLPSFKGVFRKGAIGIWNQSPFKKAAQTKEATPTTPDASSSSSSFLPGLSSFANFG